MAVRVKIKGYQSIKNAEFSFSGFTTLYGDNTIGKSACFRAIKSAIHNRTGEGFINYESDRAIVTLDVNNESFEWNKPRKASADYVYKGHNYTKTVGHSPDFVSDIGLGLIDIGGAKLDPHFSSQIDPPFLLTEKDSVVTEFFSSFLNFGTLNKALANCTNDLKETNSDIKVHTKMLAASDSQLAKFVGIDILERDLENIEKLQSQCDDMSNIISAIDTCITFVNKLSYCTVPNKPDIFMDVALYTYTAIQNIDRLIRLGNIPSIPSVPKLDFSSIQDTLEVLKKIGNYSSKEYSIPAIPKLGLKNALAIYLVLEDISRYKPVDKPKFVNTDIDFTYMMYLDKELSKLEAQNKLSDIDTQIQGLKSEYNAALKEMGVCPVCEREICV